MDVVVSYVHDSIVLAGNHDRYREKGTCHHFCCGKRSSLSLHRPLAMTWRVGWSTLSTQPKVERGEPLLIWGKSLTRTKAGKYICLEQCSIRRLSLTTIGRLDGLLCVDARRIIESASPRRRLTTRGRNSRTKGFDFIPIITYVAHYNANNRLSRIYIVDLPQKRPIDFFTTLPLTCGYCKEELLYRWIVPLSTRAPRSTRR